MQTPANNIRLLIVDDEPSFCELLVNRFQRKGLQTVGASTGKAALTEMQSHSFDVALVDIVLPDTDGISLMKELKALQPDLEILIMTGNGTIETAIQAMKLGAYHYLTKPLDLKELEVVVTKACEKHLIAHRLAGLNTVLDRQLPEPVIIGESQPLRRLVELTRKAADWDLPILIKGESGTGKELIARALHHWGARAGKPWVAINCSALPVHLLESELFGHEKGAFSGASASRMGLVEAANQGTLFLDEIGDLDPALQTKLLRFLESGEFRRLGSNRLLYANVRCISATNQNLETAIGEGRFRSDLYYRLSGFILEIPPLRERLDDIPLLAEYFINRRFPLQPPRLRPEALKRLQQYSYPGNIRELSHLIDRACLLSGGADLDGTLFATQELTAPSSAFQQTVCPEPPQSNLPSGLSLEEVKKKYILETLRRYNGNKKLAAASLKIGIRSLYRYLEEWNIFV